MGLLPFISGSLTHIHAHAHRSVHTNVANTHHTYPHIYTEVQSHQTLITGETVKQAETCTVHICRHTHTYTQTFLPVFVTVSLALTCSLCTLSLQLWFPCTRSVSAVCREHHSLIPRARQKDKRSHTKDKRGRKTFSLSDSLFSFNYLYFISELLFNDIYSERQNRPFGHGESDV